MSKLTEKQEQLAHLMRKKKECDKRALEIVHTLIEPHVNKDFLLTIAKNIGPTHFEDVVEERRLTGICGWALCPNSLPPSVTSTKQKYIIRGQSVLDITQRKAFCSPKCFAKSTHFKKQLLISPLWMRDQDEEAETATFEILQDDTELHGLKVNLTGLSLDDQEDQEEDKTDNTNTTAVDDDEESSSSSSEDDEGEGAV